MSQQDDYAKNMKGKTGLQRIINASKYSKDGFVAAYRSEQAFRQIIWLNSILILLLLCLPFSIMIKMILLLVSGLSVIVELFNTGLEAIVDRISSEYHPLSKVAKDVGSAGQFVVLTLQFMLWAMAIYTLM